MADKDSNTLKSFSSILYTNKRLNKLVGYINKQTKTLAIKDPDLRRESMQEIEKDFIELYKQFIIGTNLESEMIANANESYLKMSTNKNRRPDYTFGKPKAEDREKIDEAMYNSLKSSPFGKEDNIVRCELNREEIFPEVMTQKLALWSNKIAHKTEENSIRYMSDLNYGINISKDKLTPKDRERQKSEESRFIKNLRKAYNLYTDKDEYKFAQDKAYVQIMSDDFDITNVTDQNVLNLQKLMNECGFSRSSGNKDAMRSFLFCLRDQRTKDYLFKAKENFSKDLLLQINELGEESTLKAYYVKDYATKDNKGRSTVRLVVGNAAELENLVEKNDCVYMTKSWEESLKFENADKIVSKLGDDNSPAKFQNELDKITKKTISKGTKIYRSERDATIAKCSATVFHLPEEETLSFCEKNGFNMEEGVSLTQKTVAFGGNSMPDVGFGSKSNTIPYEKLPRYRALDEETKQVERRSIELEKQSKSNIKNKGE